MKKYILEDGDVLETYSNLDLVNQLKNNRFTTEQNTKEYMKGFAFRYKEYEGKSIRFDTIDNFVEDLIENKFLKEI